MIRSLLAAVLLAGSAVAQVPHAGPATITVTAFRDRIADALRHAGRSVTVVDERTLRVAESTGEPATLNIDAAYSEYRADPSTLDAVVSRVARLMTASFGAERVEQLVVIVRPTDYVARSLPAGASSAGMLAARPMAGDLSYFLAVDAPETIRMAKTADLARWHLTEAQAWARAIANGPGRVGRLTVVRGDEGTGVAIMTAASGLAPSLLAEPATCGPSAPVGARGEIFLVQDRNVLLSAAPADRAGTAAFWTVARRTIASGSALSRTPVTCRAGRWVVAPAP